MGNSHLTPPKLLGVNLVNGSSIDTLARTVWAEARNQGQIGMEAVAAVVMNRVRSPGWWGKDVISVCTKKFQFSAWMPSDPNYTKLQAVTIDDPEFVLATQIATRAVMDKLHDPTGGATYYFEAHIPPPPWSKSMEETCQIGAHKFFRPLTSQVTVVKPLSQGAA